MQKQSEFEALSPAPSQTTGVMKTNAAYKAKNLETGAPTVEPSLLGVATSKRVGRVGEKEATCLLHDMLSQLSKAAVYIATFSSAQSM